MNELFIEPIENGHRFILSQKKANFFVKAILFVLTIFTTAIPFIVLFSEVKESSVIVGAIISGFCALFLFRLLIWNVFGKEVFEIQEQKVLHYIDYKFFKDQLYKGEEKLVFDFQHEPIHSKGGEMVYTFIIGADQKVLTQSNIKLDQEKINEMLAVLK